MFCRRALLRIGPLARRALQPTSTNPPVRHMAFGVPGGSNNMMYFVLCGGGVTAALVYAYKTVSNDSVRYEDRVANTGSSETAEAAPAGESAPVEEVVAVTAPAEPAAETAAEPIVEVETKVVATEVPEPAPIEATAEALVAEESTAPVTAEAVPEAAPLGTMEVAVLEETTPDDPTPESAGTAAVDEVPSLLPTEAETGPGVLEAEATSAAEVAA